MTRRPDSAIALVLVLWIVMILSLIAYSLVFQVTMQASMTSARKKQLQAEALARAGVARSLIDLRNDMLYDLSDEEGRIFDAEGDVWANPEEGKDEVSLDRNEDAYFSVRVFDEDSLFNLNRFSGQNMLLLQEVLRDVGVKEDKDREVIAAAIVDWMDGDTVPVLPSSPSNDEGIAYAVLNSEKVGGETDPEEVEPFVLRNEFYLTTDELLEVYGVTPELYFGPESEDAEYYRQRYPDRWNYDIEVEAPRRRRDEDRPLGLRDYFTVYGSQKLNLNTAPEHVLRAFGQAAGQPDGDSFAESVIRSRRGGGGSRIDNDSAFKTEQDIVSKDFGGVVAVGQNLYPVGIQSSVFRIISEGRVGEVTARFEMVVARDLVNLQRDESFEAVDRARERSERNSGRWERRQNKDSETQLQYPMLTVIETFKR